MKKTICVFLTLFSLLYVIDSFAVGEYKGAGAGTCGTWIEERRNNNHHAELHWILGFISSYNTYVYKGSDPNGVFGSANYQSVAVWMDNYCQKNPLNIIATGARVLVEELANRNTRR